MAERLWRDGGAGRPRTLPADGAFCRELGVRVGRAWLGPVVAVDYGGPLIAWMGAVVRGRRAGAGSGPGVAGSGVGFGWVDDPWRVRLEDRPATTAALLRSLGRERKAGGSGTLWRSTVPAEERALIGGLVGEAEEQLVGLCGAQTGSTADAARARKPGWGGHSDGSSDSPTMWDRPTHRLRQPVSAGQRHPWLPQLPLHVTRCTD